MARHVLILLSVLALALSGCLRIQYDRCDDEEPHPDCALIDAATDAGAGGDAGADASTPDAALDAGT